MQPCTLSSLLFFVFLVAFVHLYIPTPVIAVDEQYAECSTPFHCAGMQDIGYPFWGTNRPENCGYPGFYLNCRGEAPEITIVGLTYRVIHIYNVSQALVVARTDYWNNICPAKLANTTLDLTLFENTPDNHNFTLFYGCPIIGSQYWNTTGLSNRFDCGANYIGDDDDDDDSPGYYLTTNLTSTVIPEIAAAVYGYLESCDRKVIVTGYQLAAQSLGSNPTADNLIVALKDGFGLRWNANNDLCEACASSGGFCGHNQGSGEFICYCQDHPYKSACSTTDSRPSGEESFFRQHMKLFIGLGVGLSATVVLSIVLICRFKGALIFFGKSNEDVESFIRNNGSLAPKRYTYSDIKKMTNSFADIVGRGGYGTVYKGKLSDGRLVAVKVLSESKSSGEEFINEVASMSRTSHVNIVTLLGFCHERTKRALIYEFVPNGSLDKFLFDKGTQRTTPLHNLAWETLYDISIGIARGLEYLHRGCNTRIVHFDIKPHNILLDEDFCPKISDFGLAKLCCKKQSMISIFGARGTAGYIAPEVFCRNFGGVSHKSDVYSYGMMILEMVGVTKYMDATATQSSSEMYFPQWIYKQLDAGEHLKLQRDVSEEEEERARKMIMVGLWCIQTNPSDRPPITKAVEMLEGPLESLHIPPMPFLFVPKEPVKDLSTTSSLLFEGYVIE